MSVVSTAYNTMGIFTDDVYNLTCFLDSPTVSFVVRGLELYCRRTIQLPYEMLSMIFAYLPLDRHALSAARLVCRDWSTHATPHLFSAISFRLDEVSKLAAQLRDSPHLKLYVKSVTVTADDLAERVVDQQDFPHLKPHVKCITALNTPCNPSIDDMSECLFKRVLHGGHDELLEIIQQFPSLDRVVINGTHAHAHRVALAVRNAPPGIQSRIHTLVLRGITFNTMSDVDRVVRSFPGLKHLALDSVVITRPRSAPDLPSSSAELVPLRRLSISACDTLLCIVEWAIVNLDFATLLRLDLLSFLNRDMRTVPAFLAVLAHAAPALHTLQLAPELDLIVGNRRMWDPVPPPADWQRAIQDSPLVPRLVAQLSALTQLRVLVYSALPNTARSNIREDAPSEHAARIRASRVHLLPALLADLSIHRVEIRLYDACDAETFPFHATDAALGKRVREVVVRAPGTCASEAKWIKRAAGDVVTWMGQRRATAVVRQRVGEEMTGCRRAGSLYVEWPSDEGYVKRQVI